jgi:DNA adenine methylase
MSGYFGSKATSGLCQAIIAMMPPHDTYIETHLGGGAIMKRKPPARYNIGIDIDPRPLSSFDCPYPVRLVNGCAHQFLASYAYRGGELLYCDPPYLAHTRTSARKYRFDYTQQDHIELLALLKTLPCHVILSGYPSSLYDNLLGQWNTLQLQVMNQGGVRTEQLWYNFTVDRVHWAGLAGKNFTDRQRIKRKAQRWGKNYHALPKAERLAVLAALMEVEALENGLSTD